MKEIGDKIDGKIHEGLYQAPFWEYYCMLDEEPYFIELEELDDEPTL